MLNRQKALLFMLRCADRPATRLEVTKWAFLLAHETPSAGGNAFYQFVPYTYGPFSFCLYREAEALAGNGYLGERDRDWQLGRDVAALVGTLPAAVRRDAAAIVGRFAQETVRALTDHVYRRFPRFTFLSALRRLAARPEAAPAVYTAGYQGLHVDGFLNLLLQTGVRLLVDVRRNPVSRRYGFHKSTLDRLCSRVDIEYIHVPELGIESARRRSLRGPEGYAALRAYYDGRVLPGAAEALERVAARLKTKPGALVCAEAEPERCHRSWLAEAVAAETGLPVRHLRNAHEAGL